MIGVNEHTVPSMLDMTYVVDQVRVIRLVRHWNVMRPEEIVFLAEMRDDGGHEHSPGRPTTS